MLPSSINNPNGIPTGTIIASPADMLDGYFRCSGGMASRQNYKTLYKILGNKYGNADIGKFMLPDFRGHFLRGYGGNSSAIGISQNDALQNITGTFCLDGTSQNNQAYVDGAFAVISTRNGSNHPSISGNSAPIVSFDAARIARTSAETRPKNHAVNFFIKY